MKKILSLTLVFILVITLILGLTSYVKSNNHELEQHKVQIEALKKEKASLIDEKNAEISDLNNEIEKLEREVETLNSSYDNHSAELVQEIDALKKEISELKKTVSALEKEIKELKSTISHLESENADLNNKNQALLNCIAGNHPYVEGVCFTCGSKQENPIYVREGDYIYFGEYPQSLKEDDVNITEVRDSRGYYLGSDGNFYAMIEAKKCSVLTNVYFLNGEKLVDKETYYFKVEPIKWRIVKTESGSALIVCDSIIFSMAYQSNWFEVDDKYFIDNGKAPEGTYANNYQYSDLRAWLNTDFYQDAFSNIQKNSITPSMVMNNSESTTIPNNPYADADNAYTFDKIFAPSRLDISNDNYGFSADQDRMRITSDYAIACGAYSFYETGMGGWWSRSPCSCSSSFVLGVSNTGYIGGGENHHNHGSMGLNYIGVVPALWIKL